MSAAIPASGSASPRARDVFTREEIAQLTERSDLRGAWAVLVTYGLIAASFAICVRWPGPLSYAVAVVVLGGRQLALAILMHEASHGTLFDSKWLNGFVGDWGCGRPIWIDLAKYRTHHMVHHNKTGTDEDADISLVAGFPTSRKSIARKFARDLLGITGLKLLVGRVLMDAGVIAWTVAYDVKRLPSAGRAWYQPFTSALRNMAPTLLTNGLLLAALWAWGHASLYALWVVAYLTTFNLFTRIRSMAEHACMEHSTDPFKNTRSTRAGWLARLTVAPIHVYYHLEHHYLMSVPYFRLASMHRMLRERGLVAEPVGYWDVLKLVSARG